MTDYRTVRKAYRKTKRKPKMRQSAVVFALVFAGTCLLLYGFALPDMAGSATLSPGGEWNVDARIKEAEAKIETAENKVSATGVGRVTDSTVQSRLLGRRAAITDARRKFLAQRLKLLDDIRFNSPQGALSGTQKIRREGVKNGIYFVEVEMRLDELLSAKFDENKFAFKMDEL